MTRRRRSPGDDQGLSRRPLRSDRALAFALLLAVVAVGVVTFSLFYLQRAAPEPTGPSLMQYALLTVNVVLLFALFFYLFRYLIRLVSERRAGLLGSRFKFKIVSAFIGLCLVPAMVLYVTAIVVIFAAVDRLLSPEVEQIVDDAQAVARRFYEDAQSELAGDAAELAAGLGRGALVTPRNRDQLAEHLRDELDRRGVAAVRMYFRGSTEVLEMAGGEVGERVGSVADRHLPRELEAGLSAAYGGQHFETLHSSPGVLHVIAVAPVVPAGRDQPIAALVVARRVPKDLTDRAERLVRVSREHALVKSQVPWLKAEQALLFMGFSLVIILAATWVGFYIARSITLPIQRLAEGTRELRRGNLAHVVSWRGSDELADLVDAFNDMGSDLRIKADEVSRKTGELERANIALEQANEELDRRRRHMEMLLQTMTAGVLALDSEGRVLVANPAARHILELPGEDDRGRGYAEVLASEPLSELRRAITRARAGEGLRQSREMVIQSDRGTIHLQVVLTAGLGAGDGGVGLLALFEDVTELVRAQKVATWQAVARRIAHEIKNPLTPIQLSAQRILKKYRASSPDLPAVLESGVDTIIAEVRGLKQMVDEFSQFARMPEVRSVPGDLNAMLASVADLYRGHEGVRVELALADDLPEVAFDPELLRRAVINLMDNAVEATERSGSIVLTSEWIAERALSVVSVADDGPGVPTVDRERLFLPYFSTKKGGTGLGLAIVNRIVADHDGRIRVEENRPRGARFVIELPAGAGAARGSGEAGLPPGGVAGGAA